MKDGIRVAAATYAETGDNKWFITLEFADGSRFFSEEPYETKEMALMAGRAWAKQNGRMERVQ